MSATQTAQQQYSAVDTLYQTLQHSRSLSFFLLGRDWVIDRIVCMGISNLWQMAHIEYIKRYFEGLGQTMHLYCQTGSMPPGHEQGLPHWRMFTGINDPHHPALRNLITDNTLIYYPTMDRGDLNEALENNNPVAYVGKSLEHICTLGRPRMQSRLPDTAQQTTFEWTYTNFLLQDRYHWSFTGLDPPESTAGDSLNGLEARWRGVEDYESDETAWEDVDGDENNEEEDGAGEAGDSGGDDNDGAELGDVAEDEEDEDYAENDGVDDGDHGDDDGSEDESFNDESSAGTAANMKRKRERERDSDEEGGSKREKMVV